MPSRYEQYWMRNGPNGPKWSWVFRLAPVSKRELYPDGGAWVLEPLSKAEQEGLVSYEPAYSNVRSAFLNLGENAWRLLEGQLMSEYGRGRTPFHTDLIMAMEKFVSDFGPLLRIHDGTEYLGRFRTTYQLGSTLIRHAQLYWFVFQYERVISGSEDSDIGALRDLLNATLDQFQLDDPSSEYREGPLRMGDEDGDINTDEELVSDCTELIGILTHWEDVLGGLQVWYQPYGSGTQVGWSGYTRFEGLINLLWKLQIEALQRQAPLAVCANREGSRIFCTFGGFFERKSSSQIHCSPKCRSASGSRKYKRGKSNGKSS